MSVSYVLTQFVLNTLPKTGEKSYVYYAVGLMALAAVLLILSFYLRRKGGGKGPKGPKGPKRPQGPKVVMNGPNSQGKVAPGAPKSQPTNRPVDKSK